MLNKRTNQALIEIRFDSVYSFLRGGIRYEHWASYILYFKPAAMITLEQIGATVIASFTVHILAVFFFGLAVKYRSPHIAPRCEARPRNVIYNPNPTISASCQDRGNPWLGWVPWVLKLSYEDMLNGVPGTGTRDGGLSGTLLRVNMDNIVMLRFHSYGLRVTTLGFFIYTLILLPLYWTAGCAELDSQDDADASYREHCTNLTNYDRTTLANVCESRSLGIESLPLLSCFLPCLDCDSSPLLFFSGSSSSTTLHMFLLSSSRLFQKLTLEPPRLLDSL